MKHKITKANLQLILHKSTRDEKEFVLKVGKIQLLFRSLKSIPVYIKLLFIHSLSTIGMLIISPPPQTLPKVFILLIAAASFCNAIVIYNVILTIGRKRLIRLTIKLSRA